MEKETFKIRVANESDVKAMVSVINEAYESEKVKLPGVPRTDENEISKMLKREDSHFILLTTTKGKIVGSVYVKDLDDKNAYFGMLSVDPSYRRRGLGATLQNEANAWALKNNKECMTCWVIDVNHDLRRRYHRQGFRPTGTIHDWSEEGKKKLRPECKDSKFIELSKPLRETSNNDEAEQR